MPAKVRFQRPLLKLSGEAFCTAGGFGIHAEPLLALSRTIQSVHKLGVQLAVVVGGGNFVRGSQLNITSIGKASADYMGMLATVMNAIALQDSCESIGMETRVLSSLEVPAVAERWVRRRAIRHMEKGRVVIIAAGTGNPHFTTDTAAAQRAVEIGCDVILKATKVDGVYDKDPKKHKDARRYSRVSYQEALEKNLRFMDQTAIALCREHGMPVMVMDMNDPDQLVKAVRGQDVGTLIEA
ncbi:MAG: UMP kinase [Planctomycetes bacterium]|jgi:uridylate kinase|nr:UMP kinase [Planctomycetota bacterium]MCL4729310.1 UMP kinase [Planctomycetota bacterium]